MTAAIDSIYVLALGFGPDGSLTTSVGDRGAEAQGGLRASPVPAHETTTLAFSLAHTARVRVEVLDVNGRHVRSLLEGTLAPGPHSVAWDGHDDAGRPLPPGVYLARADAAEVVGAAHLVRIRRHRRPGRAGAVRALQVDEPDALTLGPRVCPIQSTWPSSAQEAAKRWRGASGRP